MTVGFFDPELPAAVFSQCRRYRYLLHRCWQDDLPVLPIVMCNPSVGSETKNDPTIRRCIEFATREGFGSITIGNLYAFIASDPAQLNHQTDPVGPENVIYLRSLVDLAQSTASPILCAWGANPKLEHYIDIGFVRHARTHGIKTVCLGTTKNGAPKHPLYLASNTPFQEFIL